MEDLTKHQLILLTILITFVTSIATGIITFTLLSEAPVEVTQTINRVVEKTIEQVVPVETGKTETKVTTVVVSEEDRVLESISKNEKSIVRLKTRGNDGTEVFSGLGIVVNTSGVVVSDLRSYNPGFAYTIILSNGKTYSSQKVFADTENGLVFITPSIQKNDPGPHSFSPASFGDSSKLNIGQTVIAVSGRESNAVSIGRIRQLIKSADGKKILDIFSDIALGRSTPGSPILNLSGEIVGMEKVVSEGDDTYSYTPIQDITATFKNALAELAKN